VLAQEQNAEMRRFNKPESAFFAALEAFCRAYCTLIGSHRSVRAVGPITPRRDPPGPSVLGL
jgi:hypothetical protein